MEVNSLLMGSGSEKRRATGKPKAMREFKMCGHEENKSEERISHKVWKMLTPKAWLEMKLGEEVKIGLVRDGSAKENKRGGGKLSSQHKKTRNKFLQFTQTEGKKNDPAYMKGLNELIMGYGDTY